MKKLLIIGANGMLGHKLCHELAPHFDVHGTIRTPNDSLLKVLASSITLHSDVDILNFDHLEKLILDIKPNVIVNCAGVIKQSNTVNDIKKLYDVNAEFPQKLASFCLERKIYCIHFSTDCVFDGLKGFPYTEKDTSTAKDDYGKSKYQGEISNDYCLTLRTSIVGQELSRHKSLFDWVFSQKGQTVKGFDQALYTGLTTLEVAKFIKWLLNQPERLTGLFHLSSETISKYELIVKLNKLCNLSLTIEKDTDFYCDRRLDGHQLFSQIDYPQPSWDRMLKDFAKDIKC